MIFIDTSTFVAVLANEPDRDGFIAAIEAADRMSFSQYLADYAAG